MSESASIHAERPGWAVEVPVLVFAFGWPSNPEDGGMDNNDGDDSGVVRLINLPRIHDPRGDLTPIEGGRQIPFEIARVFYLYNVPVDAERGGHANRTSEQVLFALSGSFRVTVDDGRSREDFWLRDPQKGLYIGRMVWRQMDSFSQGAVSLVLASHHYDENEYYRDYDEFVRALKSSSP